MYVRLAKAWTDGKGVRHPAGAVVDVDLATLKELEADGTVERPPPTAGGFPEPIDGGRDGGAPGGRPPGTEFGTER